MPSFPAGLTIAMLSSQRFPKRQLASSSSFKIRSLHWLQVQYRIALLKALLILYKSHSNLGHEYTSSMAEVYGSLRSAGAAQVVVRQSEINHGEMAFSYYAVAVLFSATLF